MANDVEIIVTASTGDTIIKLEAVRKAVDDVSDASDRNTLASDRNAESSGRLGNALGFLAGNWRILVPAIAGAGVSVLGLTGNLGALAPLLPVLTVALA